jgi:hypothetical protein
MTPREMESAGAIGQQSPGHGGAGLPTNTSSTAGVFSWSLPRGRGSRRRPVPASAAPGSTQHPRGRPRGQQFASPRASSGPGVTRLASGLERSQGGGANRTACGDGGGPPGRGVVAVRLRQPGQTRRALSADFPAGDPTQSGVLSDGGVGGKASFRPWCPTCPLRTACTASRRGRTITIHPWEAVLQRARHQQRGHDWQDRYRTSRPAVERKISHFTRRAWGGRKARTRGLARMSTDLDTRAGAINWARLAALGLGYGPTGWKLRTTWAKAKPAGTTHHHPGTASTPPPPPHPGESPPSPPRNRSPHRQATPYSAAS